MSDSEPAFKGPSAPSGNGAGPPLCQVRLGDTPACKLDIITASFQQVKPDELQVLCQLGSGAQADVFKAEWTRSTASSTSSIVVAVKRLHRVDDISREREILAVHTDHPNVLKCFDYTCAPPYLIVTEFCGGGSLFDVLYNSGVHLSVRQRVKILLDVVSGMSYLHRQRPCIIHRDLKSGNVLLTSPIRSVDQTPVAKVCDFGLSREASEQSVSATSETLTAGSGSGSRAYTMGVGTWRWMAPEMFWSSDSNDYDESVDVFSFGIVAYEVLTQKLPYEDEYGVDAKHTDPRMCLRVLEGMRPNISDVSPKYPAVLPELIQGCWDGDPALRPAFEELGPIVLDIYDMSSGG